MKIHHSLIIAGALCGALALPAFGQTTSTPIQTTATAAHPMQLAWCRYGRCGYGRGYGVRCATYHCWVNRYGNRVCGC